VIDNLDTGFFLKSLRSSFRSVSVS